MEIIASLVAQLVKNPPAKQETLVPFLDWEDEDLWRRDRLPTPVFWPREFHGLYSPWGHKELDTTEQLSLRLLLPSHRESLNFLLLGTWKDYQSTHFNPV